MNEQDKKAFEEWFICEDAVNEHQDQACWLAWQAALEYARGQQEPVAWPCTIDEADFEQNTITLKMQNTDYTVGAGTHWLSTALPAQPVQPAVSCPSDVCEFEIQNEALRKVNEQMLAVLEVCRFVLEPYDDIKPRDWKTDRENLRRAQAQVKIAIAAAETNALR